MTRKAATKKKPKKAEKGKAAYIVVRELPCEGTCYTEPDRVFADRKAAKAHADALNRELRSLVNPFEHHSAEYLIKGGEKALLSVVKKLKLPEPKKTSSYGYAHIDWEAWWNRHYFDMTDDQRDAIWDALNRYNWYQVQETAVV